MINMCQAAHTLVNEQSDSWLLFAPLWAHFCSAHINEALKQMLAACAVFLYVFDSVTLHCPSRQWPSSFYPIFSFLFDTFLAVWRFLPPCHFLSKSHPTDANSLNRFLREHLWSANGFLARLLSISQILVPSLCVGIFTLWPCLFS